MDIPVHPTLIKNDIVELEPLNPSVEKKNHLPKLHFWDSMLASQGKHRTHALACGKRGFLGCLSWPAFSLGKT